jgi:serine/threonine protein kinase
MGEVYAATDSKLGRSVAIKCLPEAFANDFESIARFQREARVLASLNHSNIAAIYGLEEARGRQFFVMELVPGETLADKIAAGPIPLKEGLEIALQVIEALEAAHKAGILHRDLKPANIKITPDGKVKVLDFGLAKILGDAPSNPALTHSLTLKASLSTPGMIIGTACYMSPEQSRGKLLDKRSDVWAFGVVLFEMLTGRPAFDGETVADVIGAIGHKDPQWELLAAETPSAVRRLLRRCLAKDPRQRLHDIADARLEVEAALSEPDVDTPSQRVSKRVWVITSILAGVVAGIAFMAGRWLNNATGYTTMFTTILPSEGGFEDGSIPSPELSPDGRTIAFYAPNAAGQNVIWVRPLDSPTARVLTGPVTTLGFFWSPDGNSLAFFSGTRLQRIDVAGGPPQILANAPDPRGGSWGTDGSILFVPDGRTVHRIPASGGSPVEVTRLNADRKELIHGWPSFLPDKRHFLLWVYSPEKQHEGVYIGALDSPELRPLLPLRTRARYANGYLFFGRDGNLMAQRFDPDALQLSGEAMRVAERVGISCCEFANIAFSVSETGNIAFWSETEFSRLQPTWLDRAGNTTGTIGDAGYYLGLMPSPNGKYMATESIDLTSLTGDILIFDLDRGNSSRLTFVHYLAGTPVWSPDSERVLFTQWRDHLDVVSLQTGNAEQVPFPEGRNSDYPLAWSADGQNLLFLRSTPETRNDLWILPMSGDRKPRPYLNTPVSEFNGRISPDGRWVAYVSNESGRSEAFVQSFPVAGNKKRISTSGGTGPMWRRDGRELYFVTPDQTLMAVSVASGTSNEFSSPTRLFQTQHLKSGTVASRPSYGPSADGQRFLVMVPVENDRPRGIQLIHNWRP